MVCFDRCIMGQVVDWHGGPWVMGYRFWIWVDLDVFLGIFLGGSCGFDVFWVFSGLIGVS